MWVGDGGRWEPLFADGGIGFYYDFVGNTEKAFTYRVGLDYNYFMHPYGDGDPELNYSAFGGRASVLWRPGQGRRMYFGLGASAASWLLEAETLGCCSSVVGNRIVWVGTGPLSSTIAKIWNAQNRSSVPDPGTTATERGTTIGGHAFAGYQREFWHVELLYDGYGSDIIALGALQLRFGLSW